MEYIVLAAIAILIGASIGYLLYRKRIARKIILNGIRVKGIMVAAREKPALSADKLAGRIYLPTITFFTTDGKTIIGTPVLGFKSFKEVITPMNVEVIYDPNNPKMFCVEITVI